MKFTKGILGVSIKINVVERGRLMVVFEKFISSLNDEEDILRRRNVDA